MAARRKTAAKARQQGRAIVYLRVSTAEQAASGLGMEAQLHAAQAAVDARGWSVVQVIEDKGVSGKVTPLKRRGMAQALALLCSGQADVLVAAKLDRLSRSVVDLLGLIDEAERCGFSVMTADAVIDSSTPAGRFVVTSLAAVSELERSLIGERTAAALQVKKARGGRLGRPVTTSAELRARVGELRSEGVSIAKIATVVNDEGWRTNAGTAWTKSGIQRILGSLALDAEATEAAARHGE